MFWVTWTDGEGRAITSGTCDVSNVDDAAVDALVEYYRDHRPPAPVGPVLVREGEGETFNPDAPAVAYLVEQLPAAVVARRADAPPDLLARLRRLRAELTSDLVNADRVESRGFVLLAGLTKADCLSAVLAKIDELFPEVAPAASTEAPDGR